MKVKFSKFERVAGLFVVIAIFSVISAFVVVAVKKGWFERKVVFQTQFEFADGLFPGSHVQMNGLRVGSVNEVILESEDKITVEFEVQERFAQRIREDSVVRKLRPFVIGDKVLEVTVGSSNLPKMMAMEMIPSEKTLDLMDLVSGRRLGPYLDVMGKLVNNLQVVVEAFADPKRSQALIGIFDRINPLMDEMVVMSKQITRLSRQATYKGRLAKTLDNVVVTTRELNVVLPEVSSLVRNSPELGKNAANIISNLSELTNELNKLIPAIAAIAPDLPQASRRALEALDEAVVTLKAMQKSFLLSGSAEEVREEEEKRRKARETASEDEEEQE